MSADCTEPYGNGYKSTTYNGAYNIQPVTSASPFVVSKMEDNHLFFRGTAAKFCAEVQFSSVQSLDQLGRLEDMRNDSAVIIFQSF